MIITKFIIKNIIFKYRQIVLYNLFNILLNVLLSSNKFRNFFQKKLNKNLHILNVVVFIEINNNNNNNMNNWDGCIIENSCLSFYVTYYVTKRIVLMSTCSRKDFFVVTPRPGFKILNTEKCNVSYELTILLILSLNKKIKTSKQNQAVPTLTSEIHSSSPCPSSKEFSEFKTKNEDLLISHKFKNGHET
ncbi:hypothetical protein BpHYR1_036050 [Brachionus plicatilis]|uniref:Uncharacterized protein n=1 Tax=Brachionus plicatilis TaxID=10195 RepID=A0A3M7RYY1_BRAPC|nr:hypothetical protein BpHYR1_036050 [Brachionus plicatilis]